MSFRSIARYGVRSIPGEEQELISAFRRGEAIEGPALAEFERSFAAYHYMDHAITASYGRMAFYYILGALDLPPGSEIIFPRPDLLGGPGDCPTRRSQTSFR